MNKTNDLKSLSELDLLITFFEQERDYCIEAMERDKYTNPVNKARLLKKRIEWFNSIIGTITEAKTQNGIKNLEEAIMRERERKANLPKETITCANCGGEEFYEDQAPSRTGGTFTWGAGKKYICTKCGFKATRMLHKKRNIKKQFGG